VRYTLNLSLLEPKDYIPVAQAAENAVFDSMCCHETHRLNPLRIKQNLSAGIW
jgi:hypothetical protein